MAGGMGGDVDQLGVELADPGMVAAGDDPVHLRDALGLGRAGDPAAGGGADRVIAAGMIRVPVGVPDLADRPAARRRRLEHRIGDRRIDRDRLAGCGIVHQPDIIVVEHRDVGRSRAWPPITSLRRAAPAPRGRAARSARGPAPACRAAPPGRPTSAGSRAAPARRWPAGKAALRGGPRRAPR